MPKILRNIFAVLVSLVVIFLRVHSTFPVSIHPYRLAFDLLCAIFTSPLIFFFQRGNDVGRPSVFSSFKNFLYIWIGLYLSLTSIPTSIFLREISYSTDMG